VSLAGRRILLTRSEDDCAAWARRLLALGAEPLTLPCIACESLLDARTRRSFAAACERADWIALASPRAVRAAASVRAPNTGRARIAAVGARSARACRQLLGRVDLVADGSGEVGLARALAAELGAPRADANAPIVFAPGTAEPQRELERVLEPLGARVERLALYRTHSAPPQEPRVELEALSLDAVLLASPSAARGLANRARVPDGLALYAIGASTALAAATAGLSIRATATRPDLEGLLELIS